MAEKDFCPGCGRACSLTDPHCGRGREYAQTGKLPESLERKKPHVKMPMERYHNVDMNDRLILNLRDISHMMRMQYEGKASQKRILIILRESGPITQKELTERLGIQPGSASEILSKLEKAGLITRTINDSDRRTTDIRLTATGDELALNAAGQRQKRHQEMFSCLSSEERRTLLSLLEKIRSDWEKRFPMCGIHSEQHNGHEGHLHMKKKYSGHPHHDR